MIGQPAKAETAFRKSAAIYESLFADHPDGYDYRRNLALVLYNLGTLRLQTGQRETAEPPFRRALYLQDKLLDGNPDDAVFRLDLAKTADNFGTLLCELGREAEAEPHLLRSSELLDRLIRDNPKGAEIYRAILWEPCLLLGKIYRESQRNTQAMEAYRRALQILKSFSHHDELQLYGLAAAEAQCTVLLSQAADRSQAGGGGRILPLDLAMEWLQESVRAGFHDLDHLRRDSDFSPLHSRADFQELLLDLTFPVDPFGQ